MYGMIEIIMDTKKVSDVSHDSKRKIEDNIRFQIYETL